MRLKAVLAAGLLLVMAVQGCSCGTSCLVGDTEVETPNGAVRISDLEEGDEVWAVDVHTGERHARRIVRVLPGWSRSIRRPLVEGRRMHGLTPTHPVFDPVTRAFRPAGELVAGSAARGAGTRDLQVMDVEDEERLLVPVRVYDLALEGPEHAFIADGVVVHNKESISEQAYFADVALCRCVARVVGAEPQVVSRCSADAAVVVPDAGEGDPGACCPAYGCCYLNMNGVARVDVVNCEAEGVGSVAMVANARALDRTTWKMAGNAVTRLESDAFQGVEPAEVDLSGNPLQDISDFASGFYCGDGTRFDFTGTQLAAEDNDDLSQLAQRGCVVTPASF